MRILSLDLGKYKTVACEYEAENGRHRFATVLTTPKALHDLIVDREPDRVVIAQRDAYRHSLRLRWVPGQTCHPGRLLSSFRRVASIDYSEAPLLLFFL
jgi:hypothetical protein